MKEKILSIRKNKQDKAGYLSHATTYRCYSVYKNKLSILYICGDIFDENVERKKDINFTRENIQENAGSQSHDAASHCQFT